MRISKPNDHEPIRLVETRAGYRYRCVVDTGSTPDGKRKQVTKTCSTLTEAREWVAQVRADVARGVFLTPDAETFDGLAGRWLASKRKIRERTRLGYEQVLKPVRARIGHRKAQTLRRSDIEALVSWMATEGGQRGRGLAQRSIVYTLGAVRQVLAYGVAEGLLSFNVAADVEAPRKTRADEREVAVWEPADLVAFRRVADADEWAAGWRLTLSGLRRSEVMGLSWSAVDLVAGTVKVEAGRVLLDGKRTATDDPKSAASWRTVDVESMHPGTGALLRALKARQAADRLAAGGAFQETGYVLVDPLGSPVRPEAYSDRFTALCKAAGVPRIRMHDVRHTLGLTMHRAGQAPADVAALLGHTLGTHLGVYVPRTERGAITAAHALGEVLAAVR